MLPDGVYTGHVSEWWPDTSKAGNSMIVLVLHVDGAVVQGNEVATPYEGTDLRNYINLTPRAAEISMEILRMLGWSGKTFKTLDRNHPEADTLDTKVAFRVFTEPDFKYPKVDSLWEFGVEQPRKRSERADPESVTGALDRALGMLLVDAPDVPKQPPPQLDEPDGDIPF